jgi:hypothetical protein
VVPASLGYSNLPPVAAEVTLIAVAVSRVVVVVVGISSAVHSMLGVGVAVAVDSMPGSEVVAVDRPVGMETALARAFSYEVCISRMRAQGYPAQGSDR